MPDLQQFPNATTVELGEERVTAAVLSELPSNIKQLRLHGPIEYQAYLSPFTLALDDSGGIIPSDCFPFMKSPSRATTSIASSKLARAFGKFRRLERLSLHNFFTDDATQVLSAVKFPCLHTLDIQMPCRCDTSIGQCPDQGILHSNSDIVWRSNPNANASKLSGTFPRLQHIVIHDCCCQVEATACGRGEVHIMQCAWMKQSIFPWLRRVTSKCWKSKLVLENLPATCHACVQ